MHLIEYVVTQLPYAMVAAGASAGGYLVSGITQSTGLGLLAAVVALAVAVLMLKGHSAGQRDAPVTASRRVGSGVDPLGDHGGTP